MPILITKHKPKQEAEVELVSASLSKNAALIDEAGKLEADLERLHAKLAAIPGVSKLMRDITDNKKALTAKLKKLQEGLSAELLEDEADPDQVATLLGEKYQAEAGKATNVRELTDIGMLKKILDDQDDTLFLRLAQVKLGDIDAYLNPEEQDLVLTKSRGDRPVKLSKRK